MRILFSTVRQPQYIAKRLTRGKRQDGMPWGDEASMEDAEEMEMKRKGGMIMVVKSPYYCMQQPRYGTTLVGATIGYRGCRPHL
ncbi:hypothetical protein GOP47_0024980 [Adiantum capillus-veneris]|uniref:Uncharacterized protein n=1 Tax=Adiantum capillus-veneris TaxID=13818 RepID=A0A9D4U351_ADICA|nr:hypothetical protein GOP47_0024980 [Adiantum capillus-veneris]